MTTLPRSYQAAASPRSNALALPGSVEQVSNRQVEPLLCRKDGLHVAYWNAGILQDVAGQALTMQTPKTKCGYRLSFEVKISDDGRSVINVPDEGICYHLNHI